MLPRSLAPAPTSTPQSHGNLKHEAFRQFLMAEKGVEEAFVGTVEHKTHE